MPLMNPGPHNSQDERDVLENFGVVDGDHIGETFGWAE